VVCQPDQRHTRRANEDAVKDFMRFAGIRRPEEFRIVTRAHIIAWRDELAQRGLGGSTIRHRLASLAGNPPQKPAPRRYRTEN
jgi:integrase/recombinase XerD